LKTGKSSAATGPELTVRLWSLCLASETLWTCSCVAVELKQNCVGQEYCGMVVGPPSHLGGL